MTVSALTAVVTASAERSWRGPVSLGGRAWAIVDNGFEDDGATMSGGGGEALAVVGTRGRWLALRASAGLGLAVLDYGSTGPGCETPEECRDAPRGFSGARPYALAGLGVDVYPLPGVGVGAEVRPAWMRGPANVSAVEVGVRVRVAR